MIVLSRRGGLRLKVEEEGENQGKVEKIWWETFAVGFG